MAEVLVLQHADCETPGQIERALCQAGFELRFVRGYAGDPVPKTPDEFAGLVAMGGPMSVYEQDRYPFLVEELLLLKHASHSEKPVLGVCLGSQLLAAALGSSVHAGERREIGWHEVKLGPEAQRDVLWEGLADRFTAFHWHGDVYDLPRGAVALASSALTPLQAFRFGRAAYGLLFHIEVNRDMVAGMAQSFPEELAAARVDPEGLTDHRDRYFRQLESIANIVCRRWISLL